MLTVGSAPGDRTFIFIPMSVRIHFSLTVSFLLFASFLHFFTHKIILKSAHIIYASLFLDFISNQSASTESSGFLYLSFFWLH